MTGSLLGWLFFSTLAVVVVAPVLLVLRRFAQHRRQPRLVAFLWWFLIIRLAVPFLPQAEWSLFGLGSWLSTHAELSVFVGNEMPPPLLSPPNTEWRHGDPVLIGQVEGRTSWSQRLLFLWLAGVLLLIGRTWQTHIRIRGPTIARRPVTQGPMLDLFEDCKLEMGIRATFALIETPSVTTPALLGFVRPRLLLPEGFLSDLDATEIRYVFLHELGHFARGDIAISWLVTALQIMHWFNPLVWICFGLMRGDREQACDALVLAQLDQENRRDYGLTLVKLLERAGQAGEHPGLAGILERHRDLAARLRLIAALPGARTKYRVLGALTGILLALFLLTNPSSANPGMDGPANLHIGQMAPPTGPLLLLQAPYAEAPPLPWKRDTLNLEGLRGELVVLVFKDFSRNPPAPEFENFAEDFRNRGIHLLVISKEDPKDLAPFLARYPNEAWILVDPIGVTSARYQGEVAPHAVFIDREGRIAAVTSPARVEATVLRQFLDGALPPLVPKLAPGPEFNWDETQIDVPFVHLEPSAAPESAIRIYPNSRESGVQIDGDGVLLRRIVALVYNVDDQRVIWRIPESRQRYRFSVFAPEPDMARARAILANTLKGVFSLEIREVMREADVLVLGPGEGPPPLPARPDQRWSPLFSNRFEMRNMTAAELVVSFTRFPRTALLVDESGLKGRYDFEVKYQDNNPQVLADSLAGYFSTRWEKKPVRMVVVEEKGSMRNGK